MTVQGAIESPLLGLAHIMDTWAAKLPQWDAQGSERWDQFLDRRYEVEVALAAKLRNLPTCQLQMCPVRLHVDLALGGIRVSSKDGLAAACRAWADAAHRRMIAPVPERGTGEP